MTADLPIWTDDELHRLLGACDGYIHAIATIHLRIGQINYRPINIHHTRQIKAREQVIAPLRELEAKLTADLRECQEVYKRESARSALAQSEEGK